MIRLTPLPLLLTCHRELSMRPKMQVERGAVKQQEQVPRESQLPAYAVHTSLGPIRALSYISHHYFVSECCCANRCLKVDLETYHHNGQFGLWSLDISCSVIQSIQRPSHKPGAAFFKCGTVAKRGGHDLISKNPRDFAYFLSGVYQKFHISAVCHRQFQNYLNY